MFAFAYEAHAADAPVKDAEGARILTTSYEVAASVARAHGAAVVCVGSGAPPYSGDVAEAIAQDKRRAQRAAGVGQRPTDTVPDGTESAPAARPTRSATKARKQGARHA